jgi:hypothetical protein
MAKGLVMATLEIASGKLPLLLRVTACGGPVAPTVCPGKSKLAGETPATGAGPVPLSETV